MGIFANDVLRQPGAWRQATLRLWGVTSGATSGVT